MHRNFNHFFYIFLIIISISGCASTLIGGAASIGLASVQERSIKDAAIDLEIRRYKSKKNYLALTLISFLQM